MLIQSKEPTSNPLRMHLTVRHLYECGCVTNQQLEPLDDRPYKTQIHSGRVKCLQSSYPHNFLRSRNDALTISWIYQNNCCPIGNPWQLSRTIEINKACRLSSVILRHPFCDVLLYNLRLRLGPTARNPQSSTKAYFGGKLS
jgi:hypothetical protein